jgi:phage repressor protein C with HTH and peptisase S24 domain
MTGPAMDKTVVHPENFPERLKSRRRFLELSQKQLSESTGVSSKTIQKYEYGDIPKGPNLVRLSRALNCSIDWLLLGSGSGSESSELDRAYSQKEHVELTLVPKVLARLDSDGVNLEKSQNTESMYAFQHDWIKQKGDPSQMVLMDVSGDSMSPELRDGDTALVERSQTEIYIGKFYAVSIGKEVMVRYVDRAPGKIILRSANNSWNDIEFDIHEDSKEPVNILGRVVWWCRDIR